jgi:disulfide oxidoreductase YuzD
MTNAWSLLHDELYPEVKKMYDDGNFETRYEDTMKKDSTEHSKHWYDYDRNDIDRSNPFPSADASLDTITFVDDKTRSWGHSDYEFIINKDMMNSIDLNLEATEKNGFWKYDEDLTMKEVRDYLSSTYKSHYTSEESKTQTLDLIESIGDAEPFCRSNAIKYLSRFGKKNGKSKQDILKAIHYCILLYHFSGLHKQSKGNYETF